jgi:exopolyphosphatase/pppGpp-phosphohydrolase
MVPDARTRIAIGTHETHLITEFLRGGVREWMLDIGTQALGEGPFRREPPAPLELENAIEHVENAVMPLLRQMPPGSQLVTADAAARELHRLVHEREAHGALLLIDDIEQVFNQLVAVSLGRPAASAGLPVRAEFAAYVLILRETMHHLGFASLTLLPVSSR